MQLSEVMQKAEKPGAGARRADAGPIQRRAAIRDTTRAMQA